MKVRLRSFSVVSRIVLPRATPALLMRMVGFPSVERMEAAAEEMEDGEERSHLKKRTVGGAARRQYSTVQYSTHIGTMLALGNMSYPRT